MASLNKTMLIGNLGADPESRYTTSGDCVCTIRLATSESWKDRNTGEKKEATEWHRIVFYRRLAEIVTQYVKKGMTIYVEGRLKTNKWTDKDGVERYTTQIDATEMKILSKRDREAEQQPSQAASVADLEDDIPF
jgi:single-strand DNA-binding protein